MKYTPVYFQLEELVCPDVFETYGQQAWTFLDDRLLVTLDKIREKVGKPIFINTWKEGGEQKESGLRCLYCEIVQGYLKKGQQYMSAHLRGQAADFTIQGMLAEESRQWIIKNSLSLPYNVRLEDGVNWVHLDVCNPTEKKVTIFNM